MVGHNGGISMIQNGKKVCGTIVNAKFSFDLIPKGKLVNFAGFDKLKQEPGVNGVVVTCHCAELSFGIPGKIRDDLKLNLGAESIGRFLNIRGTCDGNRLCYSLKITNQLIEAL